MKSVTSVLPSVATGIVAVLVGFASSVALLFQAAQAAGATTSQASSWVFAVCVGAGLVSILFSWHYKMPILAAWSTPGTALLVASFATPIPMPEVIGAFVFCGVLIVLSGVTGIFARVANRIPVALASAMLAGVLVRFGMDVFHSLKAQPVLVLIMLAVYFAARRFSPRFSVLFVLLAGVLVAQVQGMLDFSSVQLEFAKPEFVVPAFSFPVMIGIGLPLFVVTMASQNLTGVAVLKASGYQPPISPVITGTGLATMLLAPFGAFSVNFAAITAAICAGPEAHKDPARRYISSISAGVFYLLISLFAASIMAVFAVFPKELVLSVAGIALFATIANGLASAMREDWSREAALLTFLVTASGVTLWGIGSPFWGLVAGGIGLVVTRPAK
ncbi:benzoate/H(+) symporter BenE family transporter [Bdellovibrio bacteriovorus]|uniref:benzoate/H(+) symporter BenE family transporter n=1 Tax=Bdellovibrio bacteriovorus TaxID=959 RepID=UPI003D07C3F2